MRIGCVFFATPTGTFHLRIFIGDLNVKEKERKKRGKNNEMHKINIFDLFRLIYLKEHTRCVCVCVCLSMCVF